MGGWGELQGTDRGFGDVAEAQEGVKASEVIAEH